ncbi:MAG: peptidoglycan-associated lipoprotein Pal [Gammaproteobacteria bacterium]|nr:MAG: peptidoglycan-associated lipoprotein Pal [Gammaproteobacteria bacterium]
MKNLAISAILFGVFALSGCGESVKPEPAPVEDVDSEEADQDQNDSDEEEGARAYGTGARGKITSVNREINGVSYSLDPEDMDDPENLISQRVIYFEFDSSQVGEKYKDIIMAHSEFLLENEDYKITIEGHTDEKGTREYNIGLGDRRAGAVKQIMELNGVDPQQLATVSYGEEKLINLEQTEAAQTQNRRAVLVYSKK